MKGKGAAYYFVKFVAAICRVKVKVSTKAPKPQLVIKEHKKKPRKRDGRKSFKIRMKNSERMKAKWAALSPEARMEWVWKAKLAKRNKNK
jgi:hypothetical protein